MQCTTRFLLPVLLAGSFLTFPVFAQTQRNSLILSKDASGTLIGNRLSLNLRANPSCDQTGEVFPDGTTLVIEDLTFITDNNGLGAVYGSAQLIAPDGKVRQTLMLRGTAGYNLRREANQNCRFGHIEALLEPVPTFAPVNAPQIGLAFLSADDNPQAASPLPVFRAKLDGFVTLPADRVTLTTDKSGYSATEPITAIISNNSEGPITAYDLKSYCSIVRLQRRVGENWQDEGQCFLRRLPLPVTLAAGESRRVVLMPSGSSNTNRPPGAYRLVFDYFAGRASNEQKEDLRALSATFRVNALPARQTVAVQLENTPVLAGQSFIVNIINDTDTPILVADHKTDCNLLDVQRKEANGWVNLAPCPLASPTQLIKIEARHSLSVTLPARGSAGYTAGTYRVELGYFLSDNAGQPQGAEIKLYTPEFTLRDR